MESRRPATVGDAMRSSSVSVSEDATPRRILAEMDGAGVDELPVVGADGSFRGMIERRAVERRLYDRGDAEAPAAALDEAAVARANPGEPIEAALDRMMAVDLDVLPVVSVGGRLEGLLVIDDLRRVPNLVEGVAAARRQREVAAGADTAEVVAACGLVSAGLGVLLFVLWVMGPGYGLPTWVAWVDALAAALAFIGAGAAFSREMISVPLWAVTGVGLAFAASFGRASNAGAWSTWVQLAVGIAFLLMAVIIGAALPRRLHLGRRPVRAAS